MQELQEPVRFGTEKIIGFPRLVAIFDFALPSDSSVDGRPEVGALLRSSGLAKC
jgi:hypothetical protein